MEVTAEVAMQAVAVLIVGWIYFMPAIVAKGHPHGLSIFLLNLLLGWTGVFWVLALVWAFVPVRKPAD